MSRRIDVDEYRTWILTRLHKRIKWHKEIAFDVYATSTILQWHLESLCWTDNSQDVWERFRIYWDKDYFDLHSLAASGPRLANNTKINGTLKP
ncbi:MAG: hypothetical protein R3C28_33045 [Pirellulaceae bacterium]